MIRKLTGLVDRVADDGVIIDVGGVGYHVSCPQPVMAALPPYGQTATLWIETQMSDHAISLYGFSSSEQVAWFRLLISVHGIGNKVALAILSALGTDVLADAITHGDVARFSGISGIGKRLAERIVNELKNKVPHRGAEIVSIGDSALSGTISALVNLGYTPREAREAASSVMATNPQSVEETIHACLKALAR